MSENKLNFDKMKLLVDESWREPLRGFFESEDCWNISQELKKNKGRFIPEDGKTIWRCFQETKLDDMNVLLLGLSPYPQRGIADGILFSNSLSKEESPSLKIVLDAVEDDLGYKDDRNKDLSRWSKQGILILNSALTCEYNSPLAHLSLWKPLINYLFLHVFNNKKLVICYFGKDAREFKSKENNIMHVSKSLEHPAFSARENRGLNHQNVFSWINEELKRMEKPQIEWQEYGALPWKEMEKQVYEEFI